MFIIWIIPIAPGAFVAVGVSAVASWSPFVDDIGLWLMVGSKGKFVLHKGETDVAIPGAAFATFGAEKGVGHVWTNIVLPYHWIDFHSLSP